MITVTQEALQYLKKAVGKAPTEVIRLGVKGAGCNGYSYYIDAERSHPCKGDISWHIDDVAFVVDPKSMAILSGSTLTWAHRGLMSGLEFVNPNEASRCGCGVSFTLKRDS